MTTQTTVASGYIPGAGKLQHEVGLVDGNIAEYDDVVKDQSGNPVEGLTFVVNPDFTIEIVVTGDEPTGQVLRMVNVRFDIGGTWTDYESFMIPVESYDDRIEPDPTTTEVYYTTPDGTELVRPI